MSKNLLIYTVKHIWVNVQSIQLFNADHRKDLNYTKITIRQVRVLLIAEADKNFKQFSAKCHCIICSANDLN